MGFGHPPQKGDSKASYDPHVTMLPLCALCLVSRQLRGAWR
jgi:hypothetical protein